MERRMIDFSILLRRESPSTILPFQSEEIVSDFFFGIVIYLNQSCFIDSRRCEVFHEVYELRSSQKWAVHGDNSCMSRCLGTNEHAERSRFEEVHCLRKLSSSPPVSGMRCR